MGGLPFKKGGAMRHYHQAARHRETSRNSAKRREPLINKNRRSEVVLGRSRRSGVWG